MPQHSLTIALLLAATPAIAQLATPIPPIPPVQLSTSPRIVSQLRVPRADDPTTAAIAPSGTWWRNPDTIKSLNLTPDQQRKMDDTFRQSRIQLIDLKASLEKEQLNLEPLLNANPPDTTKAMAEISRIADLRADLEKSNARMLLGLRALLTADQWTRLQADRHTFTFEKTAPFFSSHNDRHNSSFVTCTKNKSGVSECTTTTVTSGTENGRNIITTCVTAPGQTTPKCTVSNVGSAQSLDIAIPWDNSSTPPASFFLDLPHSPTPPTPLP